MTDDLVERIKEGMAHGLLWPEAREAISLIETLQAENARLKTDLSDMRSACDQHMVQALENGQAALKAEADKAELVEALKPFACHPDICACNQFACGASARALIVKHENK